MLRLRAAMLAWDCGAREAAKHLGMSRSTMYHAVGPWTSKQNQARSGP